MSPELGTESGRGAFCTTHWTVVLEAASADGQEGQEAFTRLYLDYWAPLYAYVRRRGYSPAESEDIAQDFFARLLEKQALARLRREGGRFRSFLLGAMEHFLANLWDRGQARKRGGGQKLLSLNAGESEMCLAAAQADNETPALAFEKRWAFTLLEHVSHRLKAEYEKGGKRELFAAIRVCLQGDRSGPAYSELAAKLNMSEGAVKVAVHRLRQRYGHLLREEIARTVSSPAEVDEELRHLIHVVSR